jgi:MFS family permease
MHDTSPVPTEPVASRGCGCLQNIVTLWRVLCVLALFGFASGLPLTLYPQLQNDTFTSNAFLYTGIQGGVQGILAFFYSPVLGSFSDLYGRKLALIVAIALYTIPFLLMAILNNYWVFSIANAICGFVSGIASIALAIGMDLIPEESGRRTEAFSVALGFFLIGSGAGTMCGTFLGSPMAFQVSAGVGAFNIVVVALLLKETDRKVLNRKTSDPVVVGTVVGAPSSIQSTTGETTGLGTGTDFGSCDTRATSGSGETSIIKRRAAGNTDDVAAAAAAAENDPDKDLASPTTGKPKPNAVFVHAWRVMSSNRNLTLCFFIILCNSLADQMIQSLLLLFLQRRLDFSTDDQLIFLLGFAVAALVGMFVLVSVLKYFFGSLRTLQVGLIFNMIGIAAYGFVETKWQAYSLITTTALSILVYPTASAMIAGVVRMDDAGAAQGVGSGGRMLAEGVSPFIFGLLLQAFQNTAYPGAPFLLAGLFCLVGFGLTLILKVPPLLRLPGRCIGTDIAAASTVLPS